MKATFFVSYLLPPVRNQVTLKKLRSGEQIDSLWVPLASRAHLPLCRCTDYRPGTPEVTPSQGQRLIALIPAGAGSARIRVLTGCTLTPTGLPRKRECNISAFLPCPLAQTGSTEKGCGWVGKLGDNSSQNGSGWPEFSLSLFPKPPLHSKQQKCYPHPV